MAEKKKVEKKKCPLCGKMNEKELSVLYQGKYYCSVCYEIKYQEAQDYKDLMRYICEDLYKIKAPTPLMLEQVKRFKEQFGYSYKGMKTTLHYFYEIEEGNDVSNSIGVGIIPFVYEDAKKFYIEKKAVKDSVKNSLEVVVNNTKTINKRIASSDNENSFKDMAMIDITKLL